MTRRDLAPEVGPLFLFPISSFPFSSMRYSDLITHTSDLAVGRHVIYHLDDGRIIIRNLGQRNWMLSELPEHRLFLEVEGREIAPRHSDFFTDYRLKSDSRPDLRHALLEAGEQICNGADPLDYLEAKNFPRRFDTLDDDTWSLQMSMHQTGGLPTAIYFCGLQCLIRVYELNHMLDKPGEAFRQAFINLEHGLPLLGVLNSLRPKVMPKKLYFNLTERRVS